MGIVTRFRDGFINAITGAGTGRDHRTAGTYTFRRLTDVEIDNAYRASWIMRKIVDKPAEEMVREGRDWQAEKDQIEKLEALEKGLDLWNKLQLAEIMRGLGGGAIVMWIDGDDVTQPVDPDRVRADALKQLHVWHRSRFNLGPPIELWGDPWFSHPSYYEVTLYGAGASQRMKFHPSRVVAFRGKPVPGIQTTAWDHIWWGDSMVQTVLDAVKNVDESQNGFAGLIKDARNRRVGIPGLTEHLSTSDGEELMSNRMAAMALGESMFGATFYDSGDAEGKGGEKIDDRQMAWTGMPDLMMAFLATASAAADMPATVLLGKSPDGQNSTGDSDTENWEKTIKSRQDLQLRPCLAQIDAVLIPAALGKADPNIWFKFAPLSTPTEKEDADTFNTTMDAVTKLGNSGTIPEIALAKGVQGLMVERGWLPGLEDALEETPEAERYPETPDPTEQELLGDPSALPAGQQPRQRRVVANDAAAWLTDAPPRPLYVQRKLLNATELIAWAKANGFESTLPATDMHVTVLYSRSAVDPMKMGRAWNEDERGQIVVRPGGPRVIERLGENAVVLRFAAPDLEWRHREMVEAGGSHDYPEYAPHVTISYGVPADTDIEALKPFNGELRFGPEIFEALDLDWKSKVVEDEQRRPFGDARRRKGHGGSRHPNNHFDPSQPRGLNGRWIPAGVRHYVDMAATGRTAAGQLVLTKVGGKASQRLARIGIRAEGKAVALDSSAVRHIARRHGAETRPGQRNVTGRDIASAATVLNNASIVRMVRPAGTGAKRFATLTRFQGERVYAVFEARKRTVSLVTMWIRG